MRPTHLRLGTQEDNILDGVNRHRYVKLGEANSGHKLLDRQVESIRLEYAAGGVSQVALGDRYGVSQGQIHNIVSGKQRRVES